MSNQRTPPTEAATITKTRVEPVEYDVAICPHCDLEHDPDEMVEVAVGVEPAESEEEDGPTAGAVTSICPGCSNAIFGFDPDRVRVDELDAELRERSTLSITTRAILMLVSTIIALGMGWALLSVMVELMEVMILPGFGPEGALLLPVAAIRNGGPR